MLPQKPLSLYVHIPFCRSRCGYCDFNTYAGMEKHIPTYIRALEREITHFSEHLNHKQPIHTVYFGGGTPSIIPADEIQKLLDSIRQKFEITPGAEVTLEANPTGVTKPYLESLFAAGVNRLSIGMQSAVKEELEILDRKHEPADIERMVSTARKAGILNLSLDLIFGIPGQTLRSLEQSVIKAIDLKVDHLSIYGLILHEETPLYRKIRSGAIAGMDGDLAGDMYAWLMEFLPKKGYDQYEISNWAREKSSQSQHNLQYWHNREYLGIGAGAHSHIGQYRWSNVPRINAYTQSFNEKDINTLYHAGCEEITQLDKEDDLKETIMMGLRLTKVGIDIKAVNQRFGVDIKRIYAKEISKLIRLDMIEMKLIKGRDHMRLKEKGRMLGNQVFMEFI